MRKIFSTTLLVTLAGMAIWVMTARLVPARTIQGGGLPTIPATGVDPGFVIFLTVVLVMLALSFAWGWHRERERSRGSEFRGDRLNNTTDDRLARIEQTLEAVALEVERIGEMERFATKLLASRQAEMEHRSPPPSATPPRVITPH